MKVLYSKEFVSINSFIKNEELLPKKFPFFDLEEVKNKILGKNFDLSISIVGKTKIKSLNKIYRSKDKVTDVLAFPISKSSGDVFINLEKAILKSKTMDMSSDKYLSFLCLHAMLHLKGLEHGEKMEKKEAKLLKLFYKGK